MVTINYSLSIPVLPPADYIAAVVVLILIIVFITLISVVIIAVIIIIKRKNNVNTDPQIIYEEIDMYAKSGPDFAPHDHANSSDEVTAYEVIRDDFNGVVVQSSETRNPNEQSTPNNAMTAEYEHADDYYEQVEHADNDQVLRQAAYEGNVYENTNHLLFSGVDLDCLERTQMYEQITGYERVPMVDIAQVLRQAAYEGNVYENTDHLLFSAADPDLIQQDIPADCERAVNQQVTGYERVPTVDIAQVSSCHAEIAHSTIAHHTITPHGVLNIDPYEQVPLYNEQVHTSERTDNFQASGESTDDQPCSNGRRFPLYERVRYSESIQQMISKLQRREHSPRDQNLELLSSSEVSPLNPWYEQVTYSESVQQMVSRLQRRVIATTNKQAEGLSLNQNLLNDKVYPLYERVQYSESIQQMVSRLQSRDISMAIDQNITPDKNAELYERVKYNTTDDNENVTKK